MKIEDWGLIPYRRAWERQKENFRRLIADPSGEEIIAVVEHPAVYTIGFHGNAANLLASEQHLRAIGAECIRIERGGDITYHGPGQVVMYPIINLHRHSLGVKQYVTLLENSVIQLLSEYGINAAKSDDEIGVWIDRNGKNPRKICAIGVKISHGITMHGLALNVNTDLSSFSLINPCGILDKGVTSMQRELSHPLPIEEIKSRLPQILATNLSENYIS